MTRCQVKCNYFFGQLAEDAMAGRNRTEKSEPMPSSESL